MKPAQFWTKMERCGGFEPVESGTAKAEENPELASLLRAIS